MFKSIASYPFGEDRKLRTDKTYELAYISRNDNVDTIKIVECDVSSLQKFIRANTSIIILSVRSFYERSSSWSTTRYHN